MNEDNTLEQLEEFDKMSNLEKSLGTIYSGTLVGVGACFLSLGNPIFTFVGIIAGIDSPDVYVSHKHGFIDARNFIKKCFSSYKENEY